MSKFSIPVQVSKSAKISFLLSIPILGAVSVFGVKNLILSESQDFTEVNLISIFLSCFEKAMRNSKN